MTTPTNVARSTQPGAAEDVLNFITDDCDIIVPIGFGEPPTLVDTIEGHAAEFDRVRIHQMDPFVSRRYIRGEFGTHLRHIDYYLGPGSRQAFWDGTCDLVPNHFSEMPLLLRRVNPALAIARAAGPDEHGYFSLGTNADYTSAFIGKVPFFLEVTPAQPFTYGQNQIHASQLAGWIRTEAGVPPIARRKPSPKDEAIAGHIAELIPDGCTLALGLQMEQMIPFAAGHEIIRQKKRALTLIGPISDILFDQLIALLQHHPEQVAGLLSPAAPYPLVSKIPHLLGRASLELKNAQQAIPDFEPGIRYRALSLGEGANGTSQVPDYALCLLGTARAQTQIDRAAATRSYEQLLLLWKNADPDFIPAQEARREQTALAAVSKN